MKLRVTVYADGMRCGVDTIGASILVTDSLVHAFKPMKTAVDPFVGAINGELMRGSDAEHRVVRLREEAAKEIAAALTEHLIHEMSKHDTYNGYQIANGGNSGGGA